VLRPSDRGKAPPPPVLDDDVRATGIYLAYWDQPIASLWEPGDAIDVATLALLERRLEQGEQQTSLTSSIKAYRTSLGPTWKARQTQHIRIERAEAEPEQEGADDDDDDHEPLGPEPDWLRRGERPPPAQWEIEFDKACRLLEAGLALPAVVALAPLEPRALRRRARQRRSLHGHAPLLRLVRAQRAQARPARDRAATRAPDGGGLVRELYGHPDAAIAHERVRAAFREVPAVVALPNTRTTDRRQTA
jgi:hypothetical protein